MINNHLHLSIYILFCFKWFMDVLINVSRDVLNVGLINIVLFFFNSVTLVFILIFAEDHFYYKK